MRRILSFALVLLIFLLLPAFCFADSNTVSIDELEFTVSLPTDTYVFTQETDSSSPIWNQIGLDATEFLSYMKNNGIFVEALDSNMAYEIVIRGNPDPSYGDIFNLNLYEDREILDWASEHAASDANELGITLVSDAIYQSGELKYYSFSATQPYGERTVHIKSYLSIVNGKYYQITLRSYSGSISIQQQTIKQVVDSIKFSEIKSPPATNTNSSSSSNYENSTWYKGLIAGVTAVLVGVPFTIIQNAKKKKAEKALRQELTLDSDEQKLGSGVSNDSSIDSVDDNDSVKAPTIPEEEPSDNKKPIIEMERKDAPVEDEKREIKVAFCYKCGAKLAEDALFCSRCGTKINKS